MAIHTAKIKTSRRTQMIDVTPQIRQYVEKTRVGSGICYVYVPHTTAAVMINECADPDVANDLEGAFDRLVPDDSRFKHSEGNSDSHMKSVLVGSSKLIFIENGKLLLGRWQGVFFCEFDGPRDRFFQMKVVADDR